MSVALILSALLPRRHSRGEYTL